MSALAVTMTPVSGSIPAAHTEFSCPSSVMMCFILSPTQTFAVQSQEAESRVPVAGETKSEATQPA